LLPDAKLFSSEHTNADATVRGNFELEMKQAERISGDLDIIEAHSYMAGSALWSMHDYGTDYEPVWPVQHSGILDMYRIPKEAYYRMKSRWITSPFVHIAGHWTWTGDEGKVKTVTVWSNCDEVELFLNDISLGVRQAESVFEWTVPFEPGVLKAVGRTAEGSASDTLTTAGPPDRIELSGEPTVLRADGVSVSVVTARIVDEKGITVPSADHEVTFAVQGGATIRCIGGKPQSTAAAGLARMIVQSGLTPDDVTLTAAAAGLDPGTLRLRTTGD
jgi:beta-galactosidase